MPELLFGLLTDRYERGSVLVTTNLDFASWTEIFGDSFRFKESLRRQDQSSF